MHLNDISWNRPLPEALNECALPRLLEMRSARMEMPFTPPLAGAFDAISRRAVVHVGVVYCRYDPVPVNNANQAESKGD